MNNERQIDFRYAPSAQWTCIGRPDDFYKTLVNESGALMYEYRQADVFRFGKIIQFGLQTNAKPLSIKQWTETARIPVVHTIIQYPHAVLELKAFGHLHDEENRTDVVLWSVILDESVSDIMTGLHIDVRSSGKRYVPSIEKVVRNEAGYLSPFHSFGQRIHGLEETDINKWIAQTEDTSLSLGTPIEFVSVPYGLRTVPSSDFSYASGLETPPYLVKSGAILQGAILVPQNHQQVEVLNWEWALQALESEKAFWNSYSLQPLTLQVPDPDVMDMITACSRNMLQAREIKEGIPEFQVGPTCYRFLWVVDGHFMLEAAHYLGHREEAFLGVDALLRRVKGTGMIAQMDIHLKETGIALATLVRQCEMVNQMEKLDALWPIVRNAVHFIRELRERSKLNGSNSPEYGLMPPSIGDGGLGGTRPEYTTTLWTLVGLKEIVRAAEMLGHTEDAQDFKREYEDLSQAFREHAARDMQVLPDGIPYLAMLKPGTGMHHTLVDYAGEPDPWNKANPGSATWALAHAIYPGEVFPEGDPLLLNFVHLLDLLDDVEGIPAETGWLPYKAVWNYSASFYAHVMLYAGRPDKCIDYLYAFANHATPTRVWREEQSLKSTHHGQYFGDMPHNWASAEFIRLVRNMLVFERVDRMDILPALPEEWLIAGESLRVEKTPTRFGAVSLSMALNEDGTGEIELQIDGQGSRKPNRITLHVPGFQTSRLESVNVNGIETKISGEGTVDLPISGEIRISGSFGKRLY